jgi:hypothetical protein
MVFDLGWAQNGAQLLIAAWFTFDFWSNGTQGTDQNNLLSFPNDRRGPSLSTASFRTLSPVASSISSQGAPDKDMLMLKLSFPFGFASKTDGPSSDVAMATAGCRSRWTGVRLYPYAYAEGIFVINRVLLPMDYSEIRAQFFVQRFSGAGVGTSI